MFILRQSSCRYGCKFLFVQAFLKAAFLRLSTMCLQKM